jgi:hypothetical protein
LRIEDEARLRGAVHGHDIAGHGGEVGEEGAEAVDRQPLGPGTGTAPQAIPWSWCVASGDIQGGSCNTDWGYFDLDGVGGFSAAAASGAVFSSAAIRWARAAIHFDPGARV